MGIYPKENMTASEFWLWLQPQGEDVKVTHTRFMTWQVSDIARALPKRHARHDTLFLENGDRLQGALREITPQTLDWNTKEGQKILLPLDRVHLIQFALPRAAAPSSGPIDSP